MPEAVSQQVNMKVGQTLQRTARQTVIGYYASNRIYYHLASGVEIGQESPAFQLAQLVRNCVT